MYLIDDKILPPPLRALLKISPFIRGERKGGTGNATLCMGDVCEEYPLDGDCFVGLESVEDQVDAYQNQD